MVFKLRGGQWVVSPAASAGITGRRGVEGGGVLSIAGPCSTVGHVTQHLLPHLPAHVYKEGLPPLPFPLAALPTHSPLPTTTTNMDPTNTLAPLSTFTDPTMDLWDCLEGYGGEMDYMSYALLPSFLEDGQQEDVRNGDDAVAAVCEDSWVFPENYGRSSWRPSARFCRVGADLKSATPRTHHESEPTKPVMAIPTNTPGTPHS